MARMRMKKNINVGRVVAKIAGTVLALYVGGTVLTEFGSAMNNTCSPFYKGLTLIGWTIGTGTGTCGGSSNTVIDYNGAGVLSVVGLIGIASIIMEFVEFKL